MKQQALWHSTLSEAVLDAVNALGGAKRVGANLWPSKPVDAAGKQLMRCLDDDRAEKLSLDEIDFILSEARQADCHVIPKYLERHGYKFEPVTDEQKAADIMIQLEAMADKAGPLLRQLEALRK